MKTLTIAISLTKAYSIFVSKFSVIVYSSVTSLCPDERDFSSAGNQNNRGMNVSTLFHFAITPISVQKNNSFQFIVSDMIEYLRIVRNVNNSKN